MLIIRLSEICFFSFVLFIILLQEPHLLHVPGLRVRGRGLFPWPDPVVQAVPLPAVELRLLSVLRLLQGSDAAKDQETYQGKFI